MERLLRSPETDCCLPRPSPKEEIIDDLAASIATYERPWLRASPFDAWIEGDDAHPGDRPNGLCGSFNSKGQCSSATRLDFTMTVSRHRSSKHWVVGGHAVSQLCFHLPKMMAAFKNPGATARSTHGGPPI